MGAWWQASTTALQTAFFDNTVVSVAQPSIAITGGLTPFSTTYGTASGTQTQTVSGSDLTANITATAPAGYQVASDGATFGPTATFTQSGGTASGTLSIRLAALTAPSTVLGTTLSYTSTGATTQNVTVSGTVNKFTPAVTATGTTSFTYNGSPQGPDTSTVVGVSGGIAPTGTVTYSYVGTGATTYGPSATKPTDAGTYSVTASYPGDTNYNAAVSSPLAFTIAKANQAALTAIATPSTVVYPNTSTLSSSGGTTAGAVTFSEGVSTGCSVSGTTLTVTNASGTCAVTATMAGNNNYNDVTSAPLTVTLQKANAVITFDPAPSATYPGANFTVNATTTNTDSAVLTYSVDSGPCTFVSGATFAPTGAGNCVVRADGAATNNFNSATQTQSVTITQVTHSITASKTGNGTISPTGAVVVNEGDSQAFTITPDANNHIASILVDGNPVANTSPYTFTNVTANHTIVANFALDQYSVSYNGNGNTGGTAPATQTADFGSTVIVAGAGSLVRTGYTFNGWNTQADGLGTPYAAGASFTIPASNTTLYAQWTANTPVITGGSGTLTFNGTPVGGISGAQTYTVGGTDLTADLVVTSTNALFEVSLDGTTFSSSVTLTPVSGTVATTTIYVRFSPAGTGTEMASITNTSTGAATQTVTVMGTGEGTAYYRSKQTGNWSDASTWEVSADGIGNWVNTTFTPTAGNSEGITVINGHTVTVTANTDADQATVDSGGTLVVTAALTIADGTGTDLTNSGAVTVNGTFALAGTVSGTAFVYGGAATLEYSGTTPQTTTSVEYPLVGSTPTNLKINNSFGVTLHSNRSVAGTLTLATGTLTTDATKMMTVTNTASGAITGFSAGSYVNGPLRRVLPENLTGSSVYAFPVGKIAYNGMELIDPHTTAALTPTMEVEAFDAHPGGPSGAGIETLRNNYWSAQVPVGGFVDTQVRLTDLGLTNGTDQVGFNGDATPAGMYLAKGGNVVGDTITSTIATPPPGFFAIGSPAPRIEADPYPVEFGNQILLTQSTERTLTVTNTGSSNLSISAATLVGANSGDFAVTSGPGSYPVVLGPGGSTTYGIYFTPQGLGTRNAALRLESDAVNGATYDAELTGNGTAVPTYTITASSGANGSVTPDGATVVTTGGGQTYTITPDAGYHIQDVLVDGSSVGAVGSYTFNAVVANHTISATFALNTYTITASAGAGGSISPSGAVSVNHGDNQTFTITPDANYHIAGVTVDSVSQGAVSSFTFNNVTEAHTISATFAINTYTITASAGANGSISPSGAVILNHGASQTFTITPDAAYHVADVLVDGVSVGAVTTYPFTNVTANHTIEATFAIDTYTLTYDANGGTGTLIDPSSPYNAGSTVTVLAPGGITRTGYTFTEWNTLPDGTGTSLSPSGTFTIFGNTTLYAQWTINQYSVIYEGNGNTGGAAPATQTADYNTPVTISGAGALVRTGYTFAGWNTAANGSGTPYAAGASFTIPAQNTTLYAQWTINTYTITVTQGTNGTIAPGTTTVNYGDNPTFTITPDAGYHIVDVLVDGSSVGTVGSYTFTDVSADHTITASFAINTYTITATAGANGSITPSGAVSVNHGADQTFTITPDGGYNVANVLVDGVSVGAVTSHTFTNVTANHTISATFFSGTQPLIVYVDDDWAGTTPGTDPDASGPATSFGYDSFATIQNGVAGVATNGSVIINPGTYTGDVNVNRVMDVRGVFTITGALTVTAPGASVSPGFSPGIINTGNLSLNSGSTVNIEINGPIVGTQYDQLNVTGTVSLGNATLNTALSNIYNPSAGQAFTIINNDGADAVTGTFAGLAEGDVFYAGSTSLRISYAGGSNNNDVVLTTVALCNTVSISHHTTLTGNPVTASVNVDDTTGKALQSTDFTISYNPAVVTYSSASLGPVTAGSVLNINSSTPGTLIVSIFRATPFSGAGSMLDITFNAVGQPGTSTALAFTAFKFNEGTQCISTANGSVSVISGTITGTVTYGNSIPAATRHVPNTTIAAAGSVNASVLTNLAGAYSISGLGAGTYTVTPSKSGDLNGAVTAFDAAQIAMWVVNTASLNPTQLAVADVSGAGGVSSFDAALIARFVVSLPNSGSSGAWRFTPSSTTYPNVNVNRFGDYTALLMGDVSGNWIDPLATRPIFDAETQKPISIAAATISASTNSEITLPIDIGDTTGKGILSYEFDLRYDPAVLVPAINPADLAGTISEGYSVTVNSNEPGLLRVVAFGTQPITGEGRLIKLRFGVIGAAGSFSDLTWQRVGLNEGGFDITSANGRVQVSAAPSSDASLTGRVTTAEGQPITNARVKLTDTAGQVRSATTNGFGFFQFTALQVGETYTVNVSAKRHRFTNRTVSISGDAVHLDITANQ